MTLGIQEDNTLGTRVSSFGEKSSFTEEWDYKDWEATPTSKSSESSNRWNKCCCIIWVMKKDHESRSLFQTSRFYLFAKIMLPHFSFPKSLWYLLLRKRSVFPTSQLLFCKKRFCHMFFNLCKKHSWNFSELIWLFATFFQIIRTTTPKLCVVYSTHYKCAKKLFIKTFCDG